jgi:hypothetical protein
MSRQGLVGPKSSTVPTTFKDFPSGTEGNSYVAKSGKAYSLTASRPSFPDIFGISKIQ